jgi:phosphoglycerol transferase MdoB-like AlkP superfamily enzyme
MTATTQKSRSTRRLLLEIGPLAAITTLICCKLLYFSALLPGQWWLSMNDWWLSDQDPITGWLRSPVQIAGAIQTRPHTFTATLASLLLLFAPLLLLTSTTRLVILLVVDVALTLLGVAGFLHYRFFGDVLSVSDLYVANQLPVVVPSVIRQLHPVDALYYLDIVAALALFPFYARACRRVPRLEHNDMLRLGSGVFVLGLVVGLPTAWLFRQDADGVFSQTTLRYEIASTIGILPYHLFDLWLSLGPVGHGIGQQEVERVRRFLATEREAEPPPTELFGAGSGRNVILISAESLQAFPIGLEVDGQPVAPRLAALARESLYFESFHDQTHLGTTSDAEFMALNSLHPLPARALAYKFSGNQFHGLPWILADRGYTTASAVAAPGGIWHMDRLHPAYGFQRSYFGEQYAVHEHFGEWASDGDFFPQTVSILEAQPEPFFTFMLSSSSHHPYPLPAQHRKLRLSKLEGTLLGDYLQSAHYFDRVLGDFVDTLRERGLLDRTIFVLYGDHHGFLGDSPDVADLLGFPEQSEYDHFRVRKSVPFLIRLPNGQGAGVRTVAAGHLDIAPTILSLLGIEDEQRVMLGRDLTRQYEPLVVFRDGSFADGDHYFINRFGPASASSCYRTSSGQKRDCEMLEGPRRAARHRLEISDLIIQGDLIPTLTAGSKGPAVGAGSTR